MKNSELFEKVGKLAFEAGEAGYTEVHEMWTNIAASLVRKSLGQHLPLNKVEARQMFDVTPERFKEIIKKQISEMLLAKRKEAIEAIRQVISQDEISGDLFAGKATALREAVNQIEDELNAE